jgi:hypothetical protein
VKINGDTVKRIGIKVPEDLEKNAEFVQNSK